MWELGCLLHACTRKLDRHNRDIDHLVSVLQLENFYDPEQDHGNLSLHHDRDVDDLVQKTTNCNSGTSTVFCSV